MIPSSRSALTLRRLLALTAIATLPAVAGCEASLTWHQPTPAASAAVNGIDINDMFVLGTAAGSALPAGGSAGVFLALTNTGPADRLLGITAPGSAASVQLPSGGIRLGASQSAFLTGPSPKIVLRHLMKRLSGGQSIRMVLDFANAGVVTVNVPVLPRTGNYASYSPAPPSPRPSATGSGQATASASPSGHDTRRATPTTAPSQTQTPSPTSGNS